jgi:hypothetical protein
VQAKIVLIFQAARAAERARNFEKAVLYTMKCFGSRRASPKSGPIKGLLCTNLVGIAIRWLLSRVLVQSRELAVDCNNGRE